jgi:hypothetical protein
LPVNRVASQWPISSFKPTLAGRLSMPTRLGIKRAPVSMPLRGR